MKRLTGPPEPPRPPGVRVPAPVVYFKRQAG